LSRRKLRASMARRAAWHRRRIMTMIMLMMSDVVLSWWPGHATWSTWTWAASTEHWRWRSTSVPNANLSPLTLRQVTTTRVS